MTESTKQIGNRPEKWKIDKIDGVLTLIAGVLLFIAPDLSIAVASIETARLIALKDAADRNIKLNLINRVTNDANKAGNRSRN